jgi:hypothetical protein
MGVRVVIGGSTVLEFLGHKYVSDENPALWFEICNVGGALAVKKHHYPFEYIVYATTLPVTMTYIEDE